jgi:hypothetical protein
MAGKPRFAIKRLWIESAGSHKLPGPLLQPSGCFLNPALHPEIVQLMSASMTAHVAMTLAAVVNGPYLV